MLLVDVEVDTVIRYVIKARNAFFTNRRREYDEYCRKKIGGHWSEIFGDATNRVAVGAVVIRLRCFLFITGTNDRSRREPASLDSW